MDSTLLLILLVQLVLCVASALLAARKGYNFILWILPGILGLIVLAFLGYANASDITPDVARDRRKTGNSIGAVLSVLALLERVMHFGMILQYCRDGKEAIPK